MAALALTVASCKENDILYDADDREFRTWDVAAPIGTIHAPLEGSIRKHLNFDDVTTDSEGVICISYTQRDSIKWNSEEIGLRGTVMAWDIPYTDFAGLPDFTKSFQVPLKSSDENGSYVDAAELTSGNIRLTFDGTNRLSGNIIVTIPELKKDGVAFKQYMNLPATGDNLYPLAGYKIQTDNHHELNVHFEIKDVIATGSGLMNIEFEIPEADVNYLSGYFGQITKEEENTNDSFNFFDELDFSGAIGFKDMKMKAEITNWAGVPMYIGGTVSFINDNGLEKSIGMEPPFALNISGATESGSNHTVTPGKIIPDSPFTTTFDAVEIGGEKGFPSSLKFNVVGKINPDGNAENFLVKRSDNLLACVDYTFTMPLHLKISEYIRTDTVKFDYNDTFGDKQDDNKVDESIKNVHIELTVDNHLPFDVKLAAVAIDGDDHEVESVLDPAEIKYGAEKKIIDIKIDAAKAKKFRQGNVKNIVITTSASTAGEDYVKVTKDAYIDITVGLPEAKINIPSNL
jgi:hypothetical protein